MLGLLTGHYRRKCSQRNFSGHRHCGSDFYNEIEAIKTRTSVSLDTHSLTAALDQLRVVASSTSKDVEDATTSLDNTFKFIGHRDSLGRGCLCECILHCVSKQLYNFLMSSFITILYTKNYWNWFIFNRVIQKIKMWTFFDLNNEYCLIDLSFIDM